jgi:hypothetical protein
MERYREEEMTERRAERPVNARRAYAKYNEKRDLPLLLAVRNSQFITNRQLCAQLLADGTETSRRGFAWRASRLVDLGLIETLPHQFPYAGIIYTITRSGVACLEACGEGLVSLTSESKSLANRSQTHHYLELGEIKSALRSAGILKSWFGDLELSSMNQSIDVPLAKDYDAVAELEVSGKSYRIALEYERFLKSSARYREIIDVVEEEKQVQLLVYLTYSMDLVYQLKTEFEEVSFPIAIAPASQFRGNILGVRMHHTLAKNRKSVDYFEAGRATFKEILQLAANPGSS